MWFRAFLLAAATLTAAGPGPASAADAGQGYVQRPVQSGWYQAGDRGQRGGEGYSQDILSLRDVTGMLRARFGGDLISARLEGGDRPFYVLRWRLANGEVRDFEVDAVSGQIR